MKACLFCGMMFTPSYHRRRYCSALCRIRNNSATTNPAHSKNLRRYKLKNQYGITPEQYDEILQRQNGVCNICGRTSMSYKHLDIDHDHNTGAIRGLLCHKCNQQVGWLEMYHNEITKHMNP